MLTTFADSEYGCLREVLVCPPASPDFAEESIRSVAWKNHRLAIEQHTALVNLLRSEGVHCHEMAPNIGMPYQCFMRDSSIVTPWGLLIPQMGFDLRRSEPATVEKYATAIGADIWARVSSGTLEGGDVQLLRPGIAVIGCNGERTTTSAANEVSLLFQDNGWECRIIKLHPQFMHLDIIMGVLDEQNIICCSGALHHEDRSWLEKQGFRLYDVPEEDTLNMACNVLSLGNKHILSCKQNARINIAIKDIGFHVLEIDLSQYIAEKGGIHCLVHPFRREPYLQQQKNYKPKPISHLSYP